MKLVAVSRILNEADIIEAFVRHTSALVDHHILLDNGSIDATLAILEALRAEGLSVEVRHSTAVAFDELKQNGFLFLLAAGVRGADWVLPLDADEFIDVRGNGGALRAALQADSPDAFLVHVRDYVAVPEDDPSELLVPVRITRARAPTDNMKVIVRGSLLWRGADLQRGGHSVRIGSNEVPWQVLHGVLYAHYPVRSPWQWLTKCVVGWSKVLAAGPVELDEGSSIHYREPFQRLKTDPMAILRSPQFTNIGGGEVGLTADPIAYRGARLRYTKAVDHQMCAVQVLLSHLEKLSMHHGELATLASPGKV